MEHSVFSVNIHVPSEAPPAEGFPIIIVLDGERYAPLMMSVMQLQLRIRQKTGIQPMIVVSIDSKDGQRESLSAFRFYYMTPKAERYVFPVRRGRVMNEVPAGGAQQLHEFITKQVVPHVNEHYATNRQLFLFGHSLGGLYALWSYTTNVYTGIVAVSPSLWWNEQQLLGDIPQHDTPLAIYVGEKEGDMVADATTYYDALTQPKKELYVAPLENHASVIPTVMSRALRFLSSI